ncbi:MAG: putative porin [Rikenellaceae bacterium]
MYRIRFIQIIVFALFMVSPLLADAQHLEGAFSKLYDNNMTKPDEPLDTLKGGKRTRPKRPLRSYLFNDSIKNQRMFAWTFNPYNNTVDMVKMDTALTNFQKDYFFLKDNPVGVTYLGNLGAAVQPLNFAARTRSYYISFMDPYNDYIFRENKVLFYNGRMPFTNASYFISGQKQFAEEEFTLTHQQNITPSTGINLSYRNNRTRGIYANQQSINKNLSIAISHTGRRYSFHAGYIYNGGDIRENGGLKDDAMVLDTVIDLPRNIDMMLKDAKNKFKGNVFYFTQSVAVPLISYHRLDTAKIREVLTKYKVENSTSLFFGTSFKYSAYHKTYTDTKGGSGDYYKNWYINPRSSRDSIREREIDVKVFAQFQPYNRYGILGLIGGGVGYTNEKYYSFSQQDFLVKGDDDVTHNVYIYADVNGQFRKYLKWNADFKYTPFGEQEQNMSFGGKIDLSAYIKKKPVTLTLSARFYIQSPNHWEKSFFSNHYIWNNNFDNQSTTEFKANISIPSVNLDFGAMQYLLTNKIYYSADATPKQYDGTVSVTEAYINKNFVVGGLHLEHSLLAQFTSNERIVPVPKFAANLCYYYEFNVVKNVLRMQIGAEGYYNTRYHAPGYNPSVGQFYNQRDVMTGNYPFTNVFITGKWKRMRILLKYQHLNYELYGGRDYMSAAHYPNNRGMFKYGLSWTFYD